MEKTTKQLTLKQRLMNQDDKQIQESLLNHAVLRAKCNSEMTLSKNKLELSKLENQLLILRTGTNAKGELSYSLADILEKEAEIYFLKEMIKRGEEIFAEDFADV